MKTPRSPLAALLTLSICIGTSLLLSPAFAAVTPVSVPPTCTTTREYVTALEFLRDQKQLAIPEQEARALSLQVSRGCTGAASRFLKVTHNLLQAGLGGKDSVRIGVEFSQRPDAEAETFVLIFQRAFLQEYLDLDLRASLQMARSLTQEIDADILGVRNDFERLVDFCVHTKKLDLPRPECAKFAARIAKRGQGLNGGVSKPYLDLFGFLVSESGPSLTTGKALVLAEELIGSNPGASDNFIQGYRYAISGQGLGLGNDAAIRFAQELATQKPAANR